jgi:hypothetical protein
MFLIYLRYIVPLVLLAYLIKKNPFYTSYPVALPFMVAAFLIGNSISWSQWKIVFFKMVKYSRKTNHMVH